MDGVSTTKKRSTGNNRLVKVNVQQMYVIYRYGCMYENYSQTWH